MDEASAVGGWDRCGAFGSHRPPATTPVQRLRNGLAHQMTRRLFMPSVTRQLNAERVRLGMAPLPEGVQLVDVQRSPYLHLMPTTPAFEYPRPNLDSQIHFVGPLLPAPHTEFEPPLWWDELRAAGSSTSLKARTPRMPPPCWSIPPSRRWPTTCSRSSPAQTATYSARFRAMPGRKGSSRTPAFLHVSTSWSPTPATTGPHRTLARCATHLRRA